MATVDPFWTAAHDIAAKAWDAASSGTRTQAARTALEEAGITGKAIASVIAMLADNGRRE